VTLPLILRYRKKLLRLFVPNAITPGSGDDNGSLNIRQLDPSTNKPYGTNLDLSDIYLSTQNVLFITGREGWFFRKRITRVVIGMEEIFLQECTIISLNVMGNLAIEVYRGAVTIIRR